MPHVQTSTGAVHYRDTGGDGPVLVFLHGLAAEIRAFLEDTGA